MADSITDLLQVPNEEYDSQIIPGFVQGTVVENNNSRYPGMVKVSFTVWEKGQNMIEWVRIVSPYAGKKYGSYVVPEVNDIVLVGFIGGSLKKPFLLGSLYPADSSLVKKQTDKTNSNKYMETKGGIQIALDDSRGKQSVTVTTPKDIKISLDDAKEQILLTDKTGKNKIEMDLKKGEISIIAQKKITLKTGQSSIELAATPGQVKVNSGKVNLAAKQTMNIQGQTQTKVKGGSLALQGMQTAELKATGIVSVKGAMAKIN